jgi:hypothetical protein
MFLLVNPNSIPVTYLSFTIIVEVTSIFELQVQWSRNYSFSFNSSSTVVPYDSVSYIAPSTNGTVTFHFKLFGSHAFMFIAPLPIQTQIKSQQYLPLFVNSWYVEMSNYIIQIECPTNIDIQLEVQVSNGILKHSNMFKCVNAINGLHLDMYMHVITPWINQFEYNSTTLNNTKQCGKCIHIYGNANYQRSNVCIIPFM